MRFVIFCHSIVSDWNHGNAHFLRGIVTELRDRGHDVRVMEPRNAWSLANLVKDRGRAPLDRFHETFPHIQPHRYAPGTLDLDEALKGADVVIVHEWNDPALVNAVGAHHREHDNYSLFFHDTHHRSVTAPEEMRRFNLDGYDGVLAFGDVVRDKYLDEEWTTRAWTWHEAADTRVFKPLDREKDGDLVWIGNWGDDERTASLKTFLLDPAKDLRLDATVHGVRYPKKARRALERAGVDYAGWVANHEVPEVFARHRVTVHVPRRPYLTTLPGVPTIRVFEALACGIPLVSARWDHAHGLFEPGRDFLVAHTGEEMRERLREVLEDEDVARRLAERGRQTILEKHTCAHRVDELIRIHASLGRSRTAAAAAGVPKAKEPLHVAFIVSSLVSSLWNGAATYYRGLAKALADRGHRLTFYEPDVLDRQKHRDIDDPDYADVVVWQPTEDGARGILEAAKAADVVVKTSGVGVLDEFLDKEVLALKAPDRKVLYWDVDAPATLDRVDEDPDDHFRACIPEYDLICTYGGGPPVVRAYEKLGAKRCVPVYNALDPGTHHPAPKEPRFRADLAFLGNRLPDREERVEEFFLRPAAKLPDRRFLIGGSGWGDKEMTPNVEYVGHVGTKDHNAFNCTPLAVLNISRASMARYGYSPATRVFEAAGAGACIVTDAWEGIDTFLAPGKEILVAEDGDDVARILADLTPARAREIGRRARARVLADHTYADRAAQVEALLTEKAPAATEGEVVLA